MNMTSEELKALKTEITTDPAAVGYAAVVDDHVEVAKLINRPDRSVVDRSERPTWQLASILPAQDVATAVANPVKAAMLQMLLSLTAVNPNDNGIRSWIVSIFGAGTPAVVAWNKWGRRSGSRAEELGLGRVTESDVADALLRT